jgi:hypothetical protein
MPTTTKRLVLDVHPCKGGWEVRRDGDGEKEFERKSDALANAKEQAKAEKPSQIRIHGRDGRFQNEHTYGTDPRRSKG